MKLIPNAIPGAILALALVMMSTDVLARANDSPFDNSAPIAIEADSAEQDEKAGVTTYSGNVTINQGPLSIVADVVKILSAQSSNKRIVKTITAQGAPATFTHIGNQNADSITARAKNLEYSIEEGKIILQDNASLLQRGSSVSGDTIEYFIAEKRVRAQAQEGAPQSGGRVRTVITPGAGIRFDAP